MANHEVRPQRQTVKLLLAFSRKKDGVSNQKCIRVVINDYDLDLKLLEEKCKLLGGHWRIHKTINNRNVTKAKIWLLHKLIENSHFDGCIDSLWRTALLQKECADENNFLLDVDTENFTELKELEKRISDSNGTIIEKVKTPNGWHYVTNAFDTRKVCILPYVTLIRDGYVFIKEIK